MKGTFAQAELHIIRARLHGGKLNKASKGELRFALPVGFVFEGDKIVLDPDQEVQGAVRTVFDLFARESTAFGVVQRFNELGLRFPRRALAVHGTASLFGAGRPIRDCSASSPIPPTPALMCSGDTKRPKRSHRPAKSARARA